MTKPREFWISFDKEWLLFDEDPSTLQGAEYLKGQYEYHVIEKQAYDAIAAEVERLRGALEFYADQGNWKQGYKCLSAFDRPEIDAVDWYVDKESVITFGGKRAREALNRESSKRAG